MRRPVSAVIGMIAVAVLAACSTDQPSQQPLLPTAPSLAANQQCKNQLANTIDAKQDQLFSPTEATALDGLFNTIKGQCPMTVASPAVLAYLQRVVDFRGTVDTPRAQALVGLWNDVTLYATGTAIGRPYTVLLQGVLAAAPTYQYQRSGGAAVLDPVAGPLFMYTFDGQAGVKLSPDPDLTPTQTPTGPHFWTMDPAGCPATTLRLATTDCYEVKVYPEVTVAWNPTFSLGMCMRHPGDDASITHAETGYGTEVLPDGSSFPWDLSQSCAQTHPPITTWLRSRGGPLGRVLATGLDYLSPRPLFADDAGESGSAAGASPFGAAFTTIFAETFDNNALGTFANQTDPDVGDNATSWDVYAPAPGFVEVQNGSTLAPGGGLPGNVIVLSQAQGACTKNCPVYRLLGTRVNPTPADQIGIYEVSWTSLQTKPNIKEAPFVLLSASGAEIARLSYISKSNQNKIVYNGTAVPNLFWTQNVAQRFRIVVRLNDNDGTTTDYRTTLFVNDVEVVTDAKFRAEAEKTFSTIGYRLDGIDAGIMAADNIFVKRMVDKP